MSQIIARVALPVPLNRFFDYLVPDGEQVVIGGRVSVPFGRNTKIGVVVDLPTQSDFPLDKLKPIRTSLDSTPLWSPSLFQLLKWCSQYYQHSLGETLNHALPSALRQGKPANKEKMVQWQSTTTGKEKLLSGFGRAILQEKAMRLLEQGPAFRADFQVMDIPTSVLKTLEDKGFVSSKEVTPLQSGWPEDIEHRVDKPKLNEEQVIAIATVNSGQDFACHLLEGVTGSGKTEVYLNMIKPVIERGQQALVLVPEIGLTPQTINRFKRRFNVPIEVVHSGLSDTERLNTWIAARDKQAGIVIGTRSALMTPFADLGIIIIDEEHDTSYKQQDSLRYHARDVAIMRANKENIPIILGSATPSFETLNNALSGKYRHLLLSQRAGGASKTSNAILDIKGQYLDSGLSAPLIAEIRRDLEAGNQVLLFLNRRGFSPAIMCHECGWVADCQRCDAYYTFHQYSREIRCHHCGSERPVMHQCHSCGSTHLVTVGVGTEQLEEKLQGLFPDYRTLRIDRDSTRRKGSLETALSAIHNGEYQILIGTQMLAKGHHFPNVTLVALLDVDGSLYSSDFRASERLAQLFIQVAGRAGRASKAGRVILQTHHPEHPLLKNLVYRDYSYFSKMALEERKIAQLPPFSHLVLIRSEATHSEEAETFLRQCRHIIESHPLYQSEYGESVVFGPTPAPIAKKAGKYRWQLLFQAPARSVMIKLISASRVVIETMPLSKKVRWNLDIDPQDFS
ncbi:primosomal protein N' [Vibrio sp.]|nr:primosomal protein N' [Vibrio sp.]